MSQDTFATWINYIPNIPITLSTIEKITPFLAIWFVDNSDNIPSIPSGFDASNTFFKAYPATGDEIPVETNNWNLIYKRYDPKNVKIFGSHLEINKMYWIYSDQTVESLTTGDVSSNFFELFRLNLINPPLSTSPSTKKTNSLLINNYYASVLLPSINKNSQNILNNDALKTLSNSIKNPIPTSNIESLIIAENITEIDLTDVSLQNLEFLNIPFETSLENIKEKSFAGSKITNLSIPKNTNNKPLRLGENAFQNCSNLRFLSLPSNIEDIAQGCFQSCTNLNLVIFDQKRFGIEDTDLSFVLVSNNVFADCSAIQNMFLPTHIKWISNQSFSNCNSLININLQNLNHLQYIGQYAFENCTNLEEIEFSPDPSLSMFSTPLPDSEINTVDYSPKFSEESQLYNNKNISIKNFKNSKTIHLIKDVKGIDKYAFANCTSLKKIKNFQNTKISNLLEGTFYNDISLTEFIFPKTMETVESFAFYNCKSLTNLFFENKISPENLISNVTTFAKYTVQNFNNFIIDISNIRPIKQTINEMNKVIDSSINTIKQNAFYGCENLELLLFPQTLLLLEKNSFSNCNNLKYIFIQGTLPDPLNNVYMSFYQQPGTEDTSFSKVIKPDTSSKNNINNYIINSIKGVFGVEHQQKISVFYFADTSNSNPPPFPNDIEKIEIKYSHFIKYNTKGKVTQSNNTIKTISGQTVNVYTKNSSTPGNYVHLPLVTINEIIKNNYIFSKKGGLNFYISKGSVADMSQDILSLFHLSLGRLIDPFPTTPQELRGGRGQNFYNNIDEYLDIIKYLSLITNNSNSNSEVSKQNLHLYKETINNLINILDNSYNFWIDPSSTNVIFNQLSYLNLGVLQDDIISASGPVADSCYNITTVIEKQSSTTKTNFNLIKNYFNSIEIMKEIFWGDSSANYYLNEIFDICTNVYYEKVNYSNPQENWNQLSDSSLQNQYLIGNSTTKYFEIQDQYLTPKSPNSVPTDKEYYPLISYFYKLYLKNIKIPNLIVKTNLQTITSSDMEPYKIYLQDYTNTIIQNETTLLNYANDVVTSINSLKTDVETLNKKTPSNNVIYQWYTGIQYSWFTYLKQIMTKSNNTEASANPVDLYSTFSNLSPEYQGYGTTPYFAAGNGVRTQNALIGLNKQLTDFYLSIPTTPSAVLTNDNVCDKLLYFFLIYFQFGYDTSGSPGSVLDWGDYDDTDFSFNNLPFYLQMLVSQLSLSDISYSTNLLYIKKQISNFQQFLIDASSTTVPYFENSFLKTTQLVNETNLQQSLTSYSTILEELDKKKYTLDDKSLCFFDLINYNQTTPFAYKYITLEDKYDLRVCYFTVDTQSRVGEFKNNNGVFTFSSDTTNSNVKINKLNFNMTKLFYFRGCNERALEDYLTLYANMIYDHAYQIGNTKYNTYSIYSIYLLELLISLYLVQYNRNNNSVDISTIFMDYNILQQLSYFSLPNESLSTILTSIFTSNDDLVDNIEFFQSDVRKYMRICGPMLPYFINPLQTILSKLVIDSLAMPSQLYDSSFGINTQYAKYFYDVCGNVRYSSFYGNYYTTSQYPTYPLGESYYNRFISVQTLLLAIMCAFTNAKLIKDNSAIYQKILNEDDSSLNSVFYYFNETRLNPSESLNTNFNNNINNYKNQIDKPFKTLINNNKTFNSVIIGKNDDNVTSIPSDYFINTSYNNTTTNTSLVSQLDSENSTLISDISSVIEDFTKINANISLYKTTTGTQFSALGPNQTLTKDLEKSIIDISDILNLPLSQLVAYNSRLSNYATLINYIEKLINIGQIIENDKTGITTALLDLSNIVASPYFAFEKYLADRLVIFESLGFPISKYSMENWFSNITTYQFGSTKNVRFNTYKSLVGNGLLNWTFWESPNLNLQISSSINYINSGSDIGLISSNLQDIKTNISILENSGNNFWNIEMMNQSSNPPNANEPFYKLVEVLFSQTNLGDQLNILFSLTEYFDLSNCKNLKDLLLYNWFNNPAKKAIERIKKINVGALVNFYNSADQITNQKDADELTTKLGGNVKYIPNNLSSNSWDKKITTLYNLVYPYSSYKITNNPLSTSTIEPQKLLVTLGDDTNFSKIFTQLLDNSGILSNHLSIKNLIKTFGNFHYFKGSNCPISFIGDYSSSTLDNYGSNFALNSNPSPNGYIWSSYLAYSGIQFLNNQSQILDWQSKIYNGYLNSKKFTYTLLSGEISYNYIIEKEAPKLSWTELLLKYFTSLEEYITIRNNFYSKTINRAEIGTVEGYFTQN